MNLKGPKFKKENGASLFEMLMVVGIVAAASIFQLERTVQQVEIDGAKSLGNNIISYSEALSRWIIDNQFSTLPQNIPQRCASLIFRR